MKRGTKYSDIVEVVKMIKFLRGAQVKYKGATWEFKDGAVVSGSEQHRGKEVLVETRADGTVYTHWSYKWEK